MKYTKPKPLNFSLRFFLTFIPLLFTANLALAKPDTNINLDQKVFQTFAIEILDGILSTDIREIPAYGGYGKPRIVIAPFNSGKDYKEEATPSFAREFNSRLLAALTKEAEGKFRFFAHETITQDLLNGEKKKTSRDNLTFSVTDLARHAKVDIIVLGSLRIFGPRAYLSYKAISTDTGIIFAATTPRRINLHGLHKIVLPHPRPVIPFYSKIIWPNKETHNFGLHSRRSVIYLQRVLNYLGYRAGDASGIMNVKTREAIRAYQWHHNLRSNGRLTNPLLKHIERQLTG